MAVILCMPCSGMKATVLGKKCTQTDGGGIACFQPELSLPRQRLLRRNRTGPAPDNLIARDFKAEQPERKWLTAITECRVPTGKVGLSPVVDCFGGKVVSGSLSTRPDAEQVSTRPDNAVERLNAGERPVIHSDADVNSARKILAAGHTVPACGRKGQGGHTRKKEPTGMVQATA